MDAIEKLAAEEERRAVFFAKPEPEAPRSDIRAADYPVTIIGCVRGMTGWYRAGYDQRKRMIIPMQMIQRRSIFFQDDCPMCANSNRKTNSCRFLPIDGGTPCRYYHLRPELEAVDVGSARICSRTNKTNTINKTNTAEGRKQ